jgi:hypothetical protein
LDCFLKPKVGVIHIAISLLQLIKVHSNLQHSHADLITHSRLVFLKFIFKVSVNCLSEPG